ncbi:MAG TPA: hypothetical protein VLH10_26180, partial [Yinghuangia sp.]|nr:hypothetical protein [Yinghuangia sp.]
KSFVWDGIIVDGIWGTLTGLGTLLNPWSDNFGAAWKGLGQLATGLALLAVPLAFPLVMATKDHLPGPIKNWVNDSLDTTLAVGKSLIAWDEWSKNPARAAGLVTFNVVTTVATLGTGTAVKGTASGASAATRAVSVAAKVGTVIDPMTYIAKGLGAGMNGLTKISTVTGKLVDLSALKAIELPDGSFRLPDNIELPPAGRPLPELPPGTNAVELPDRSVRLPDGSTLLPDGTLKLPEGINQTPETIPVELSAADRALLDGTPPELVNVGANQTPTQVTAQVGDGLPGSGVPNNLPGGAVPNVPGGAVPNMPGGGAPPGPTAELVPPSGNGLPETPGGTTPTPGSGVPGDGVPPGGSQVPGDGLPTGPGNNLPPTGDLPPGTTLTDDLTGPGNDPTPTPGDDVTAGPADDVTGGPADDVAGGPGDSFRPGTDPEGPPPPKPDEASTTAQQRTWDEYWVNRANHEGAPPLEYYRSDGHRWSIDEGAPQIRFNNETNLWQLASDRPAPIQPKPFLDEASGTPGKVDSPEALKDLDAAAAKRQTAIDDLQTRKQELADAEAAYKANPSPENAAALDQALKNRGAATTAMRDAAEAFGESAARQMVEELYPNSTRQTLLGPKNGNHQFDQVWKTEDGRYVVIEAKSSTNTPLGARDIPKGPRVSQGTRPYFDDILRKMMERGETKLVGELKAALANGKLDYVVVKGKPDGSTYGGYTMGKFDIG